MEYSIFGGDKPVTLKKMIQVIEEKLGKKAVIEILPMQPGDVERTYADISEAKEAFGYEPKMSFEDGIEKFIKWYKGRI